MNNILALNQIILLTRCVDLRWTRRFFAAIMMVSVFSLMVFYVFQVNNLTSSSYSLQDYQKNIEKLTRENEMLEKSLAGTKLLSDVEGRTLEFGFEKVNKINYIQTIETSVASAK